MKSWFDKVTKPIIGLAPMHQVTNSTLRLKCRKAGADVVYSEMIASEAIIRDVPKAIEMASFGQDERPIVIQIFGADPRSMAKAAKKLENEFKPDGIDINFGCPVQKAAKQGFGACQLFEVEKSAKIVKAVKDAVSHTPISAKIRLATKDINDTIKFVAAIKDAGIDLLAIHGRSATQKYRGEADWEAMYKIKSQFPDLMILGNGDIKTKEDIKKKLGNLDGVLVGRAAKINPNVFKELK